MQDSGELNDVAGPAPSSRWLIESKGLQKAYHTAGAPVHALRGVSLRVRAGEFVAVMGASGSGKSTLLHLLGGLDEPSAGTIVVAGADLGRMDDQQRTLFRRRRVGIVFQTYNLLPTMSALENVALPAMLDSSNHRQVERTARRLLDRVNLSGRLAHRPQALSGGEQQRVAIARALVNDPAVILADEPTGNLDTHQGAAIWQLLAELVRQDGRTVIAVTHEADGATFADRVIILKDGRMVGEMHPGGEDHAAVVAARYRELVD